MVSACSRSVCSLRLFSCSSFPFMLASSLVMVLSDCERSDDDGSGAVAPVVEALDLEASNPALLSVSLPAGGAGTVPGSSAAASCTAGGCAGLSTADACGGLVVAGGAHRAMIDLVIDLASRDIAKRRRHRECRSPARGRPERAAWADLPSGLGNIRRQRGGLGSSVLGNLVLRKFDSLRTGACGRDPRAFAAAFHSGNQPVQPRKVLLCALDPVVGPCQPAIGALGVRLEVGKLGARQACGPQAWGRSSRAPMRSRFSRASMGVRQFDRER